jgi:DNA-binding NarL/FixJ family response regulator
MAVRTVIADDHQLILLSLRAALEADPGFEVVGETDSGAHVLPLVARTTPELVVMDVRMPGMDGLTALDLLRSRHPEVKVVLLSATDDREVIQSALRRGASGYLLKSINPDEIPAALRAALNQNAFFAPAGGETSDEAATREAGLTERELAVLKGVARGLSNKQISQEGWVTEQTVKFHLTNVYRKLGVANRAEAVGWAHRHGLVDP